MEKIIHERLGKQGLLKTLLPLGTSATKPHAPIFVSPKLEEKSRIVLVFGEPTQDLGILAGRMATGEGGLNKGSMVSVVSALQQQTSSPEDSSAPAILLANMGQHYWWPEGKRALTIKSSAAIPLPSMVHAGRRHFAAVNDIPGSEDPARHMEHLFCDVLPQLVGKDAKIDIIAIGDSCEKVEQFFDEQKNWLLWGHRLSAMLLMGTVYPTDVLTNSSFKQFLREVTHLIPFPFGGHLLTFLDSELADILFQRRCLMPLWPHQKAIPRWESSPWAVPATLPPSHYTGR